MYNLLRLGFRPGCTFDGTRLLLSSSSSTFRLLDPKRDTSGPYFFLSSCLLGRLLQLPSPSNLFPLVVVLSSSSSSDFSLSFFAQQEQALTLQISLIALPQGHAQGPTRATCNFTGQIHQFTVFVSPNRILHCASSSVPRPPYKRGRCLNASGALDPCVGHTL